MVATRFQLSTGLYKDNYISGLRVEGMQQNQCFQHTFNSFQQNKPSTQI